MAERREVSQDITEAERRDLVRRIALRGSRGRDLVEQTVAPSQDFSAAAEAAIAADPVQFSATTMDELSEIVNAPTVDAARYAEAQREVFRRGQERELAGGQQYFDDARTVTEATNFALGEYEDQLEQLRDERSGGDDFFLYNNRGDFDESGQLIPGFSEEEARLFEAAEQQIQGSEVYEDFLLELLQFGVEDDAQLGSGEGAVEVLKIPANEPWPYPAAAWQVRQLMIENGESPQAVVAFLRGLETLHGSTATMAENVRLGPGGTAVGRPPRPPRPFPRWSGDTTYRPGPFGPGSSSLQ